jgi:SAM-dependent methyltransferase
VLHEDRRRAGTFGEDAERYDRARPTYPEAVVDVLTAEAPRHVLDIGCGTGKVGVLLAERGCRVLGVEPDARMAAVARDHGLEVEVVPFEEWDRAGRLFDLAVAAQAWHWIRPERGAEVVAGALRPGGRLGLLWNLGAHRPEAQAALDEVYGRLAPSLTECSAPLGRVKREGRDDPGGVEAVIATDRFEAPELLAWEWEQPYSRDQWLDVIQTHSSHRLIPEGQRAALVEGLGEAIDRLGGSLRLHYRTVLYVFRRPS